MTRRRPERLASPRSASAARPAAAARVVLVATAVLLSGAGCDLARPGARCLPGARPARDATHVLVCTSGRWRRVLPIARAAQLLVAQLPGSIEVLSGPTARAASGGPLSPPLRFRVLRRDGRPLGGVHVEVSGDGLMSNWDATADADGVATFAEGPIANDLVGTYDLTARVMATEVRTTIRATNGPGEPAALTLAGGGEPWLLAGERAPEPLVVRAVDAFGRPASGWAVTFRSDGDVSFSSTGATTTVDGAATTTITAGATPGNVTVTAAVAGANRPVELHVDVTVRPGAPALLELVSGDGQRRRVGDQFDPLRVRVRDRFGTPTPGAAVTFAVSRHGDAAVALPVDAVYADAEGVAEIVPTAASGVGISNVVATVDGRSIVFTLTNE